MHDLGTNFILEEFYNYIKIVGAEYKQMLIKVY